MEFEAEKEFEERSDNIDKSDLAIWNIENEHFLGIQRKLKGPGAKLLVGPRGTGKTHQMRIVYQECVEKAAAKTTPVCIFTSFGKYYYLEPLLGKAPNAIQIFHAWALCKITDGVYHYCHDIQQDHLLAESLSEDILPREKIEEFISLAERVSPAELMRHPLVAEISISRVVRLLETLALALEKSRIILLLDDAALTFTPDYLVEFFDIFRNLKTRSISPKASVYPGTTQYGPRFHIGHDAEIVDCWLSVMDETYLQFMNSLVEKRFQHSLNAVQPDILDIFKYASFGIPRAFISMLRNYNNYTDPGSQVKFNKALAEQAGYIRTEYNSISLKMPQFKGVIETGMTFFNKVLEALFSENKDLGPYKTIHLGIEEKSLEQISLAERMIRFLVEAGLLYPDTNVRHGIQSVGEQREYRRFIPHLLFLIQNRTFSGRSRGFSAQYILQRLRARNKKHPLRRTIQTILTDQERAQLKLEAPPCQKCFTPRLTEDQKFCHVCGSELVRKSAFENCMNIGIDELPIADWQKDKIKSELKIKTIGDLIGKQNPGTELRKIRHIGPKRSEYIHQKAIAFVDEFLT